MKNRILKKKIIVGLSGGVDSSVAAAILKNQGWEVLGVYLRLWRDGNIEGRRRGRNDTEEMQNGAEGDARDLCKKLDIPLKIVDVREKFKKKVVKYFLDEYRSGRTPNPCVFCNENLKFKALFEETKKIEADYVATGHYARLRREIPNYKSQITNLAYRQAGKYKIQNTKYKAKLFKASDKSKDQSYFLYRLKQEQLSKLIFPLGEYKKTEVRRMAREMGLKTAEKRDSQNVCFLLDDNMPKFLRENIGLKNGKIVDQGGEVVGKHEGLPLYTIGQRKGIRIGGTGPYYVTGKDFQKNILQVTNEPEDARLNLKSLIVENISWTREKIKTPFRALVATRYQQKEVYATIKEHQMETKYEVEFDKSQKFIAQGQSAVFYSEEGEVLGGGIIGKSGDIIKNINYVHKR
jgi:tRNA-uridine 2-sulfurtransferase